MRGAEHIIYKSKPFYLWFILTPISIIAAYIITSSPIIIEEFFFYLVVILIVSCSVFSFEFYPDYYRKKVLFLGLFPIYLKKKKYSTIYCVEVRKINAAYQNPYVIIHRKKSDLKSLFNSSKMFVYKHLTDILPLISFLKESGVDVINNIERSSYREDYETLNELLAKE